MRYFEVSVNHYSVTITEVFRPLRRYDWRGAIDGVTVEYCVSKEPKGIVKNWFERGTAEIQYHARNISQTGFVAWQANGRKPRQTSKKEKLIQSKMKELL